MLGVTQRSQKNIKIDHITEDILHKFLYFCLYVINKRDKGSTAWYTQDSDVIHFVSKGNTLKDTLCRRDEWRGEQIDEGRINQQRWMS